MQQTFSIPVPPNPRTLHRCHGGKRVRTKKYDTYITNVMFAVQAVKKPEGGKFGVVIEFFSDRIGIGTLSDIMLETLSQVNVIRNQADIEYLTLRRCDSEVICGRHRDTVRITFITPEAGDDVVGVLQRKEKDEELPVP